MFSRYLAPAILLLGLVLLSWLPASAATVQAIGPAAPYAVPNGHRLLLPISNAAGMAAAGPARTRIPRPTRTALPPTATATAAATATMIPTTLPTKTPTAVPTLTHTQTPTAVPSLTPTVQPTSAPTLTPTPSTAGRWWGLLGNDGAHLSEEFAAGIRYKLITVRWKSWQRAEGSVDQSYVTSKLNEINAVRNAGLEVILSTGIHDAPAWVHANYPDSYYVNQYGEVYSGDQSAGDVNFIFNPQMRGLAEAYLGDLFARLGTDFAAVRVGGGRYGELTYPPAVWNGRSNVYWDFDRNAQAQSPVPGWQPGNPSPAGEAQRFLDWHLQKLVDLQNWNFSAVRRHYPGPIMILYPSWGIRPGDIDKAVATNLNGSSSAERNGEIQRGFDFARQVASITDAQAIVTTTWLDADGSQDGGSDQRYWSPVHYLASLAQAHPLRLALYGENTGHGSAAEMDFTAAQMARYGLLGLAWYNETEILTGTYATLADYRAMVDRYGP